MWKVRDIFPSPKEREKRADPFDADLGNEFDLVDSRRLHFAQSVLGIAL